MSNYKCIEGMPAHLLDLKIVIQLAQLYCGSPSMPSTLSFQLLLWLPSSRRRICT